MEKQEADKIITEYLPKIYGFAMKKAFDFAEAEELCAEMTMQVYQSLRNAEEIYNPDGYVWRICEHTFARYASSKKKQEGVFLDEMVFPVEDMLLAKEAEEEMARLRLEIAFLISDRRRIVYSFYYENKSIAAIARETGIAEGTVKWHLNKARKELEKGIGMERKIGRLGIKPVEAVNFGHAGTPIGGGPEQFLEDSINLNIVYSVYESPKTKEEIAEELGMTLTFIEERVQMLEDNGFLVRLAKKRYTTYVWFQPEIKNAELEERILKKRLEIAGRLAEVYVPKVREAVSGVENVYIPGGNRQLLEAALIFYGVANKCLLPVKRNLSRYMVNTTKGGSYIAVVYLKSEQNALANRLAEERPSYLCCGNMTRGSHKYPSVVSWAVDSRYSSRKGTWKNNLVSDYDYLYEFMTGAISEVPANEEKFARLRKRQFVSEDLKVNLMVAQADMNTFFKKIPELEEEFKKEFIQDVLEIVSIEAQEYPPQMRDLVIEWNAGGFIGNAVALMVLDILYEEGVFRELTEAERITSNLIMFSDVLPEKGKRR